jgi:hypothetical protein
VFSSLPFTKNAALVTTFFSDNHASSGTVVGGGTTVPEFQNTPNSKQITYSPIIFLPHSKSELSFFEKSFRNARSTNSHHTKQRNKNTKMSTYYLCSLDDKLRICVQQQPAISSSFLPSVPLSLEAFLTLLAMDLNALNLRSRL